VTILPATASFEEAMSHEPDGFFLSNGPGDPAATGEYAIPVIRRMLDSEKPVFGICLGHQLLALAVGGKTAKMFQGHRGANHPVKRLEDGRVEITSMNHGFAVERDGLPNHVRETHVSLFDGSNCGLELTDRPAFSVQYHPEASPGPQDSFYLFEKFVGMMSALAVVSEPDRTATTAHPRRRLLRQPHNLPKIGNSRRVLFNNLRGKVKWLDPNSPVPRELAEGLIRSSAWWHTHSSGRPVRAPKHAKRIFGDEMAWKLEFGANTIDISRAIRLSCKWLNGAYDDLSAGRLPEQIKVRSGIQNSLQRSVMNINGDFYDLYPLSGADMMFGAQSIDVDQAAAFLIKQAGLSAILGTK
jgi:anthranilate/para-aminobenzoate synthase component II